MLKFKCLITLYIYEDPEYTTCTGADCRDTTTGSSTSCTGATLTTINNNYNRDMTMTMDGTCNESQFNEPIELYPTTGTKSDSTSNNLKGNLNKCKKAYTDYLNSYEARFHLSGKSYNDLGMAKQCKYENASPWAI